MLLYLIPAIIIFCSLVVIGLIAIRKFPQLTSLNLQKIPHHREASRKEKLLERRLRRRSQEFFLWSKAVAGKSWSVGVKPGYQLYNYLVKLERRYHREAQQQKKQTLQPEEIKQKIKTLYHEAEAQVAAGNYLEAEKNYIAAIALDNRDIESYYRLAEIYRQLKDFEHAKESLEFALRLNNQAANCYYELGLIKLVMGLEAEAKTQFEQAVKYDKNNPKYLDNLLELSLKLKDRFLSWTTYNHLKEVNPDNQKLQDFALKLGELDQSEVQPK